VTPLITIRKSVAVNADAAALMTLCSNGLIPRIFISLDKPEWEKPEDSILRLKGIFPGSGAAFSVRSSKPGRLLICVLYSKGTGAPLAA
jgi:hypothetical protein